MNVFHVSSRGMNAKRWGKAINRVIMDAPHLIPLISLPFLVVSITFTAYSHHPPLGFFIYPHPHQTVSQGDPDDVVSIAQLLSDPTQYHKKIVKVRGTVTQPELHVDESGLFIRFVFVLKDSESTLIVFGHHDRTQGNIQIETNEMVEVVGIFWKKRTANDHQFKNNLEALTVTRYPPLHPHAA